MPLICFAIYIFMEWMMNKMPKAVRLVDIAERVGVSTVTVSKALAGKEGVSEEIREKIKRLADEMGYRPGFSMKKGRKATGNIGILIPAKFVDKNNSFYWNLYERVVSRLSAGEYYGILEMVRREDECQLTEPRVMQEGKIDGLILIGQADNRYREMLQKNNKVPVMFLDSYDAVSGDNSVISDGYFGMYLLTNHLIALGHHDIRFVGTINSTSSISDRYFGYCRAMAENSLSVGPDMIIPDRDAEGSVNVLLPKELPTAFACNCDVVASDVINKLKEKGLRVPDDISIVGFDDYVVPGLSAEITTYAVDMDGMARACVERLYRKIHNSHYIPNLKIVSGHLVVRQSTQKISEPERPLE